MNVDGSTWFKASWFGVMENVVHICNVPKFNGDLGLAWLRLKDLVFFFSLVFPTFPQYILATGDPCLHRLLCISSTFFQNDFWVSIRIVCQTGGKTMLFFRVWLFAHVSLQQGGRSCAGARVAPAEKFGVRKGAQDPGLRISKVWSKWS